VDGSRTASLFAVISPIQIRPSEPIAGIINPLPEVGTFQLE